MFLENENKKHKSNTFTHTQKLKTTKKLTGEASHENGRCVVTASMIKVPPYTQSNIPVQILNKQNYVGQKKTNPRKMGFLKKAHVGKNEPLFLTSYCETNRPQNHFYAHIDDRC